MKKKYKKRNSNSSTSTMKVNTINEIEFKGPKKDTINIFYYNCNKNSHIL